MFQAMPNNNLLTRAQTIVERTMRQLPAEIRALAAEVPVTIHPVPSEEIIDVDLDPDIMGLFVGEPHGMLPGSTNGVPAQILLFVDNILEEAEGDLLRFDEEVRITYLHELGHYLGWDEDDVEARGL
jgi:predicted Zn-dependent protease with MMP-like domain